MKNRIHFLHTIHFVFGLLAVSACQQDSISPEPGNLVTNSRAVSGFSGLTIESGITTTIVKGTTEGVTIETPEGYQPYILTEVDNGSLRIRVDTRLNLPKATVLRAVVTMKTLTNLTTSGGVRVTGTDDFKPANLVVKVSGGSVVTLPLTADGLTISSSGGSDINMSGTVRTISVSDLSGGGTLKLANLAATTCTLNASGGSVAEVNVSQELNVTASGGSTIRYRGNPKITQNLSGGSSVGIL